MCKTTTKYSNSKAQLELLKSGQNGIRKESSGIQNMASYANHAEK